MRRKTRFYITSFTYPEESPAFILDCPSLVVLYSQPVYLFLLFSLALYPQTAIYMLRRRPLSAPYSPYNPPYSKSTTNQPY